LVQIVEGSQLGGVELTGHSAVENRKWLGADVLAEQEILVIAEAERLVIIRRGAMSEFGGPAVDDQPPVGEIADGRFPLIARCQAPPLHNAAAGKAQEARFHLGE